MNYQRLHQVAHAGLVQSERCSAHIETLKDMLRVARRGSGICHIANAFVAMERAASSVQDARDSLRDLRNLTAESPASEWLDEMREPTAADETDPTKMMVPPITCPKYRAASNRAWDDANAAASADCDDAPGREY